MQSSVVGPERKRGTGYLPTLDGWRAIAVLGVMMTHDRPWMLFGHTSAVYKGYGGFGVYVFFAISGFLITGRILEEEQICGRFSIRNFYVRRLFRIQPAALTFLVAIAVLMLLGLAHQWGVQETRFSWLAALFLFTNYIYHPSDAPTLTGHFWTLAVEEHFYILLSLTLYFVKRRRALVLGAMFLSFALLPHFAKSLVAYTPRSTQWQLTSLLLASLTAVLMRWDAVKRWAILVLRPWLTFLCTPMLMILNENVSRLRSHQTFVGLSALRGQLPFAFFYLAIFWIVATVYHPGSLTSRLLETRAFRFVGKISYSLYLWHVLVNYIWNFLGSTGDGPIAHIQNHWLRTLAERPLRYATAFGVAYLCYRLVERRFIRLGHELAPAATSGRPELADMPLELPARDLVPAGQGSVDGGV